MIYDQEAGPEGAVDGGLAEGQAGGVRAAQQSVERVDEVGERTADARPGVATQLARRRAGRRMDGGQPGRARQPAHERAWATRAVLGEEQWIAERPMDTAMAVDVAATAAGLVAMVAARRRRAMPAAAATALEMGLLLAYWELMARYYDRNGGVR